MFIVYEVVKVGDKCVVKFIIIIEQKTNVLGPDWRRKICVTLDQYYYFRIFNWTSLSL